MTEHSPVWRAMVAQQLALPVADGVRQVAADIAALYGDAARAVLFYGSCLREARVEGLMLDFYLIVSDYAAAYDRRWLGIANRLIPPNVFPYASGEMSAKYAVLSEADFARLCSPATHNVSVWARFAQPTRLVWASDDAAVQRAIDSVTHAAPTLIGTVLPQHAPNPADPLALWRRAFSLTYGAELRAERGGRPDLLVDHDPDYYRAATAPVLALTVPEVGSAAASRRRWAWRRMTGKTLTLIRLAKASLTFAGGIDYLAWKINRHAGTAVEIRPWQRRWPILASFTLLPKLWRGGAIR